MARVVGAFAASHSPLMVNNFDDAPPAQSAALRRGFDLLRDRIAACRPDVVISVSDDHFRALSLASMPAFQIGIAPESTGLGDWNLPATTFPNHRPLALALVRGAFARGFDPAYSAQTLLDHGHVHVLHEVFGDRAPVMIPITINTNAPPSPAVARCIAFGRVLGAAIAAFPEALRVVTIASGGLSHSPSSQRIVDGLPVASDGRRGEIAVEWDRAFITRLCLADLTALSALGDAEIERDAGRGGHEIRNWLCAWAIAGSTPAELIVYEPIDAWITGMAIVDLMPESEDV